MNNVLDMFVTVLDEGHMEDGDHMMGGIWGWGMWFWMIAIWVVLLVIAYLVYRDAESRGMNGLLWFVLVIIPWLGFFFLVFYLIMREERTHDRSYQKSADVILDERYALGEISQKEYMRMKNDIGKRVTI